MKKLLEMLAPFAVIARELTAIRELYEAELATRDKPIYRVTEAPSKYDTEVTYGEEKPKKGSILSRLMLLGGEDDDEYEDSDDKPQGGRQ